MKTSSGLIVKSKDLYLICHPTGSSFNIWDIPKGNVEDGESELEAAYREAGEETGLNFLNIKGDLSLLGKFKYYGKPKELIAFLLEAEIDLTKEKLQCLSYIDKGPLKGMPEHDEFKWVSLEQAIFLTHKTVSKAFCKLAEFY